MNLTQLKIILTGKTIEESLRILVSLYPARVIFTTSFGLEDQAITHIIFKNRLPIEIATLDTGRLFPETYKVFNETIKRYNKDIRVYFPDYEAVEEMMTKEGPFSFYYSKEKRLECCRLRKVIPLKRALNDKKCWITGIRSDQSGHRASMEWIEFDEENRIYKYHPLFNWSYDDVKAFIMKNDIPYNTLHDKGFVSIGCEPCTRAVEPGEYFRAGRWWWENGNEKECGVHMR